MDAPTALRAFEEVDGVEIVVKILKRTGVPKDIRYQSHTWCGNYQIDAVTELNA